MQNQSAQGGVKKKKKQALVYKPMLTGRAVSGMAAKRGLHILAYQIIFVVVYLLIGSVLTFDSFALRLITNLFLVGVCGTLMYMDGSKQGEDDAAFGEIAQKRKDEGKNVPASELDRCFHPAKGFFSVLMGVLPLVLVCLIYAVIVKRQTYTLQSLPNWVSAFTNQTETGAALGYYNEAYVMGVQDVLRILVRFLIYPYVNIAGIYDSNALLLVDRLSPLLVLIIPVFYGFGYQNGKKVRAMVHGSIRSNEKRHRVKEKKRLQAQKKKPEQLI